MKILTFSTLYPNTEYPSHGIFVETRLRHLLANYPEVKTLVVAPVPWFPFRNARFGRYARYAQVPRAETRNNIRVLHPRYTLLPKIGMTTAPYLLARAMAPILKKIIADGFDFDLIDAHYYYPDGVAATLLGKQFNKPVFVTARGSDINLISQYDAPRKMILQAAANATASITVSQALKSELTRLGADANKIHVLRNGVDLELFHPVDRQQVRTRFGWSGKVLLSVGNLVELKGHHIAIDALRALRDYRLVIVGNGEEKDNLHKLAKHVGVADRVSFVPSLSQAELRDYYGAADALILASSREGWPNVLLEAMACGTPIVATRIGGIPEVVTAPEAGLLVTERTVNSIAAGVNALFASYPNRQATRRYAECFDWRETSDRQMALFRSVLNGAA